jgi:hypothetical protein
MRPARASAAIHDRGTFRIAAAWTESSSGGVA